MFFLSGDGRVRAVENRRVFGPRDTLFVYEKIRFRQQSPPSPEYILPVVMSLPIFTNCTEVGFDSAVKAQWRTRSWRSTCQSRCAHCRLEESWRDPVTPGAIWTEPSRGTSTACADLSSLAIVGRVGSIARTSFLNILVGAFRDTWRHSQLFQSSLRIIPLHLPGISGMKKQSGWYCPRWWRSDRPGKGMCA